jgi:3-hydroxyisobutyrate dehydrogenase
MTKTISVLGLGAMGLPMAKRLAAEFQVRSYDPSPERAELAAQAGIEIFKTAREAVADADAALLAVRDHSQLDAVLFGAEGISTTLAAGTAVILTSTVGEDAARQTAKRLGVLGVGLVDAPVSGGPARAERGDLLIVVGAEPEHRANVLPFLAALSSTLKIVGDRPGAGQALKTVNQLLCGVHIAAANEALALAKRLGLELEPTLDALQAGAAASFMLSDRGPRIIQGLNGESAPVLSRADIFVKDMGIVAQAARQAGLATPVAAAAEQSYLLAQAAGLGADDDSSIAGILAR